MEKNKIDTIIQGIVFSVVMAVIFFIVMGAMLENKFQVAYKKGYDEGKKHCFDFYVNNTIDDMMNIGDRINFTYSLNFS